jgi:hypothetical protein
MVIYLIGAFVLVGLVNGVVSIAVKAQVNRRLPEGERFSWWNRFEYFEVMRKHRELVPERPLPDIAQFSWVIGFILFMAIILMTMMHREHGNSF